MNFLVCCYSDQRLYSEENMESDDTFSQGSGSGSGDGPAFIFEENDDDEDLAAHATKHYTTHPSDCKMILHRSESPLPATQKSTRVHSMTYQDQTESTLYKTAKTELNDVREDDFHFVTDDPPDETEIQSSTAASTSLALTIYCVPIVFIWLGNR